MRAVRVTGETRCIGVSQGYRGLSLRDGVVNCAVNGPNTPDMTSVWIPDATELAALNLGAGIAVRILGTEHPPIILETEMPAPRIVAGPDEEATW